MTNFNRFQLDNGLKVIVIEDDTTPLAVVNLLYNVGARHESEDKTGFAHLFEHLMFGGSKNAPNFDEALQKAGGENNAFTSNDITNYYEILPAVNIETAFWLEADRMRALNINQHSLSVQQKVVVEEFKENYLNQPYGDVWHKLRKLAYKKHPYKWPTIGKNLAHIKKITLDDVQQFFDTYYTPNNAILVVAGNVKTESMKLMTEKWFGKIPIGKTITSSIPEEPEQKKARKLTVVADVPASEIYKVFHMGDRFTDDYYTADLLTDILSNGKSSRLYQNLVKRRKIFSGVDAYITGNIDKGLIGIQGRLAPGVDMKEADDAIWEELENMKSSHLIDEELEKIKNKVESSHEFNEVSLLNRAFNFAFFELIGNADWANTEKEKYLQISAEDLHNAANELFQRHRASTLYYHAEKN